jgi:hypothetical protein
MVRATWRCSRSTSCRERANERRPGHPNLRDHPQTSQPLGVGAWCWISGGGGADERDDEPSNVGVEVLEYPFMVWGFPRVITLSTLCNGQA